MPLWPRIEIHTLQVFNICNIFSIRMSVVTVLTRINMQEAAFANARVDFQLNKP